MSIPKHRRESWRARYGPWAVVTGASDGIGREMARAVAAAGVNVVLVARRAAVLAELAAELQEANPGVQARGRALDLAHPEAFDALAAETAGVDVGLLVAAAGFGTSGSFLDADAEQEREMLAVNCGAVLRLSLDFGRRLAARGRGGIVLLSSIVAFQGVPRAAHYAATKAYVQTLAEGLRGELAPRGVDVLASAPGPVKSGFEARARMRMGATVSPAAVAEETLAALGGRRATVAPGWLSKLLSYSLRPLPRFARVRIMTGVMRGLTQHHADLENSMPRA